MDYRELSRTLRHKLGAEEVRSGNHIYYSLSVEGKEYPVGKISHSARGQALEFVLHDTAKRLKLNRQEFLQFADCIIERDEFMKLWQERDP